MQGGQVMKTYRVTVTRETDYFVNAASKQEAIDLALEEDPRADSQGGADNAVAVVVKEID